MGGFAGGGRWFGPQRHAVPDEMIDAVGDQRFA